MRYLLRPLRLPDDYAGLAELLNTDYSEPTTAEKLRQEDDKMYAAGHTYIDENGLLAGYDRTRQVAVTDQDEMVGYVISWRAPWTEPGYLNNSFIVHEQCRKQGIGQLLLRHAGEWGRGIGATTLVTQLWDDSPDSLQFAKRRGFAVDRHLFQSVLSMEQVDWPAIEGDESIRCLEQQGLRFTTLADEPGGDSELKLYELYKESFVDIPGFTGEVPVMEEWRKWHLQVDGYAPDQVILAVDGDKYAGVSNVVYNPLTNGMYHEYTGVSRAYRGRKVGLGLKIKAVLLAKQRNAAYIRTDNDSMNKPILSINHRLGYEPLRGFYRMMATLEN